MLKPFALVLLCACSLPTAHASAIYDLKTPDVAAVIDGVPLSNTLITLMQTIAASREPEVSRATVLHALLEDRLIAAHARANYPANALIATNKVAYSPAMQQQQALVANLQAAFGPRISAAVARQKGGNLNALVQQRRTLTAADWLAVLGPPRLLLEYALTEEGRTNAANTPVLSYRFGQEPALTVSFLDIYEAQNVQGRHQLHQRDNAFVQQQANLLLEQRYVLFWARTQAGLSASDYSTLTQMVADRQVAEGWLALIGVANDIHADNAHLKALAAAVTPDEVRAYYLAHKDQFRRIEKVHARHIRVADEARANAVYAQLEKGADFATLAKTHSQAPTAASGGDLGWIIHGEKNASWLETLAFVQKPHTASRPFRSPGAPGDNPAWEILLVDNRVDGYQAADSDAVRYVAANAIAKASAQAEYQSTLDRLWQNADMHIAPALTRTAPHGLRMPAPKEHHHHDH